MPTTSRDAATPSPVATCPEDKAKEALALMVDALQLLDSSVGAGVAGAPHHLGKHPRQGWGFNKA